MFNLFKKDTQMDMKLVEIKCQGSMELSIDELKPFQGELKELSHESYEKLKGEILRHGFSEPIGVWKHENEWKVLSGHQRLRTLIAMRDEGFKIPKVPVSMIYAKDVKDAKEKILALTSQYGEITDQGLYEFMNESNIDLSYLDNLRMPEIDLDKWKDNFVEPENSQDKSQDTIHLQTCPSCGFDF
jgi:hypothetical protein